MVGRGWAVRCGGRIEGRKESGVLRLGLKNVTRVNASEEEKRMSIIDSDHLSRMAVFPRGRR